MPNHGATPDRIARRLEWLRILVATVFLVAAAQLGSPGAAYAQQGPASVSDLAARLSKAVVNISTTRRFGGRGQSFPQAPEGSPLEEFLDERNPNFGLGPDAEREAQSLGSGFVISSDGLIVTNNHVIDGAAEILAFFPDGTRLSATIVGADQKTDLAVLKVESKKPFAFVNFGDSDTAEVGDWVMAIGNPFGLGGSVSLGIVSARNRNINSGPYDSFIQTDAAINQGNSGGPLFDMNGDVVGINTAIIARGGGSIGIGFAVPGNLAGPIINQLVEFGEPRRGWLGVGIQAVSDDIAASLGRSDRLGALVVEVMQGSPAKGVLEDGDLILEFDGRIVEEMRDLPRIVAETEVGKKVRVRALRGDVEAEYEIVLGLLAEDPLTALEESAVDAEEERHAPEPEFGPEAGPSSLTGLLIKPLDETLRTEFSLPTAIDGAVIVSVEPGSDAEIKGLVPGMVIEKVNNLPIQSHDDLMSIAGSAQSAGREAVSVTIVHPTGRRQVIGVRLG